MIEKTTLMAGGLTGAAGVALSAVAAHSDSSGLLTTAAQMLLFHAPAFLALATLPTNRFRNWALFALLAGVLLFSGDLFVRRQLGWDRLFPMAAPGGGILMISGWLLVALSAFGQNRFRK